LFTTLRVNSPSFSGRIVSLFDTMLVQQGEGSGTPTEPHHTPSPKALSPSHTTHNSPSLPSVTTASIPTVTPTKTTPIRDVSQGEACPTDSGFIADLDRATIDKSSTLPHDSAPRVTSSIAQEVEINRLKERVERVKMLEDREGVAATRSGDDAPIKGRSMDEGEAATERISDDSEEMATVLTSIDAATVLESGMVDVPTCIFATTTVVTPYSRRKGKKVMMESKTPKKQRVQEQIDAQEVPEEAKSPKEVIEEKVKEMMQLVHIEEVYVEAIQVKHPIIDWKVYHGGQRSYWKIIRLVKETLSNRPPTSEKEMELWVELNRMYEQNDKDQLQRDIHAGGEGLPSEKGSGTCDDLLQASSGKLLLDGK
nr:hypothetical protein [Tanacetum cinerariifolium]